MSESNTSYFFGFLGASAALVFSSRHCDDVCLKGLLHLRILREKKNINQLEPNFAASIIRATDMGAAYGTAKSGVGVASMGIMRPELVMKSIVPVVMAGVLGIYGLIIAVIIGQGIEYKNYSGKSSSMGLKPQLSLISC